MVALGIVMMAVSLLLVTTIENYSVEKLKMNWQNRLAYEDAIDFLARAQDQLCYLPMEVRRKHIDDISKIIEELKKIVYNKA